MADRIHEPRPHLKQPTYHNCDTLTHTPFLMAICMWKPDAVLTFLYLWTYYWESHKPFVTASILVDTTPCMTNTMPHLGTNGVLEGKWLSGLMMLCHDRKKKMYKISNARTMRHDAADLSHKPWDEWEVRRPTDVSVMNNQNLTWLDVCTENPTDYN